MLLDTLLPRYDFSERHTISTTASAERAYAALRTADLTRSPVVRALLTLRGMRRSTQQFPPRGFFIVADEPPNEVVIGLQGAFWSPFCKLHDLDATTFAQPVPHGVARGAWNFTFEQGRIVTETRVLCADDARAKFRAYWTFIRPFSGLTRRFMLRALRDEAERGA
jgi:hypothetical protein